MEIILIILTFELIEEAIINMIIDTQVMMFAILLAYVVFSPRRGQGVETPISFWSM